MSANSPILWIVATPLGNLGDFSPRAKSILQEADVILAEDTRRAGLLCQHCGISPHRLVSFHDHNEDAKLMAVLHELQSGKIFALISDAGLPLMADPGYRLVRACRQNDIAVSVVPGPSAPVTALAGSGIPPQPFAFFGFLPRDRSDQEKLLAPFASLSLTLVFFERKDRLKGTLSTIRAILGEREVCVARELTKTHENFLFGRLLPSGQLQSLSGEILDTENLLGEITVVVGPPEAEIKTDHDQVLQILAEEQESGGSPREIARRAQLRTKGWTSKALYAMLTQHI